MSRRHLQRGPASAAHTPELPVWIASVGWAALAVIWGGWHLAGFKISISMSVVDDYVLLIIWHDGSCSKAELRLS